MDPNANLKELRSLAESMLEAFENEDKASTDGYQDADGRFVRCPIDQDDAARLAELVLALDGWISGGGFLPFAWKR